MSSEAAVQGATKSTHRVEVVPVVLEPHPNADALSIVSIFGYSCVVRSEDWKSGALGAYVPPDSVVETMRPEFAFLAKEGRTTERIRAKRLRGVMSQGVLIPAPLGSKIGDDAAELLGVTHYEPPVILSSNEDTAAPPGYHPIYDLESWYRYKHLLQDGEIVAVTEKLHGCSARYVFTDGEFHAGSHRNWKKRDEKNLWWQAVAQNPWIEAWCRAHPGLTVYAEVYGQVQDLRYGSQKGEYRIAMFDILRGGEWLSYHEIHATGMDGVGVGNNLGFVPELYFGPYSEAKIRDLIDGASTVTGANHVREGVVIKPVVERTSVEIGRVALKAVSAEYLSR